jgi:hypothetical protein
MWWIREWNVNKSANHLDIYMPKVEKYLFSSYIAFMLWRSYIHNISQPITSFILQHFLIPFTILYSHSRLSFLITITYTLYIYWVTSLVYCLHSSPPFWATEGRHVNPRAASILLSTCPSISTFFFSYLIVKAFLYISTRCPRPQVLFREKS